MPGMKVQRLLSLPQQLEANCLYITKNDTDDRFVDLTFTGDDATKPYRSVTIQDVDSVIQDVLRLDQGRTLELAEGVDLNNLRGSGLFRGHFLVNAPDSGWWSIISMSHDLESVELGWRQQIAVAYGDTNTPEHPRGTMLVRTQVPETNGWSDWDIVVTSGNARHTVHELVRPGVWSNEPLVASAEFREMNLAGSADLTDAASPRIRLHWLGRAMSELGVNASGQVHLWAGEDRSVPNSADSHCSLVTRNISAYENLIGSARIPMGGIRNSDTQSGWWRLGIITLSVSEAATIRCLGTNSYTDQEPCSGETTIHFRATNRINNRRWSGHYYGNTAGSTTILGVAVEYVGGDTYRIYVRTAAFCSINAIVDISYGTFTAEGLFVGPTLPTEAVLMRSEWRIALSGNQVFGIGDNKANLYGHDLVVNGDNYAQVGPNSLWGGAIRLGGMPEVPKTTYRLAQVTTTDGNLHLDSAMNDSGGQAHGLYLNWYSGTDGVYFGDGTNNLNSTASNTRARVDSFGNWTGRNVSPLLDATYGLGSSSMRYNTIYLASNPIVTSDGRKKTDIGDSLGLPFLRDLNPVSYRILDAKTTVERVAKDPILVERQVMETVEIIEDKIEIREGVPVLVRVPVTQRVPVFDHIPIVDESGEPVLGKDGVALTHPVPRMEMVEITDHEDKVTVHEGVRRHMGFIADDVLETMVKHGISTNDFAGLIIDEETGLKGLRYEQFIAPLVRSVQALDAIVSQQQEMLQRQDDNLQALRAQLTELLQRQAGQQET